MRYAMFDHKRYQIRIIVHGMFHGYLMYRDKTEFCKRTAVKHAKDCVYLHGWNYVIEEV